MTEQHHPSQDLELRAPPLLTRHDGLATAKQLAIKASLRSLFDLEIGVLMMEIRPTLMAGLLAADRIRTDEQPQPINRGSELL